MLFRLPIMLSIVAFTLCVVCICIAVFAAKFLTETTVMTFISPEDCMSVSAQDQQGHIYQFDINRRLITHITHQPLRFNNYRWSPDYQHLLINETNDNRHFLRSLDGSLYMPIENLTAMGSSTWSPDGRYLAYVDLTTDFVTIIDTQQLDSAQSISIPHRIVSNSPQWSMDSRNLMLVVSEVGESNTTHLYRIDLNNNENNALFALQIDAEQVSIRWDSLQWSPDSSQVAFIVNVDSQLELHTLNLLTGISQSIRSAPNYFYNIVLWSPDGEQIAFSAYDLNVFTINLIDVDGQNEQTIYVDTQFNSAFHSINWSPDGAWMNVHYSHQTASGNLIVDVRERNHRVMRDYTDFNVPGIPHWANDGTLHIMTFRCERFVYIEHADGTNGQLIDY